MREEITNFKNKTRSMNYLLLRALFMAYAATCIQGKLRLRLLFWKFNYERLRLGLKEHAYYFDFCSVLVRENLEKMFVFCSRSRIRTSYFDFCSVLVRENLKKMFVFCSRSRTRTSYFDFCSVLVRENLKKCSCSVLVLEQEQVLE